MRGGYEDGVFGGGLSVIFGEAFVMQACTIRSN